MHFHDSYDWAMLLVEKAKEKNLRDGEIMFMKLWDIPIPHQISQAALSVLKDNK